MTNNFHQIDIQSDTSIFNRYFQESIGSCHAYLTMREDFRQHVRTVQNEIGFKNLRCHGIFHDWVGVYQEVDGEPSFNFQNVNKIYDFFVEQGLKPYVELSFMPSDLASEDATVFRYKANISPPKNIDYWAQMITALAEHLIARYGLAEVKTWYFEVWNEPDLKDIFWSGSQQDYFELYKSTVTALKGINENLKVGGPSTSKNLWIEEFIAYCDENQLPIDFISTHHYCADAALEENADVFDLMYRGQKAMRDDVLKTVTLVKNSVFCDAEIHYSEWNVSPCHEDRYGKDSEFNAVFVLQTLKDLSSLLHSYSYWCISDIFEETGPGKAPFSGKYGLININDLKKPVFHAYKFLTSLYDHVLPITSESAWLTMDDHHNFRLLTWNFNEPTQVDFNGGDYQLKETEVGESFQLTKLFGRYRVRGYRVDRDVGNSYRSWQAMGSPQYLTQTQTEQLMNVSEPELFFDKELMVTGELDLSHQLSSCAIVYYDIEKID